MPEIFKSKLLVSICRFGPVSLELRDGQLVYFKKKFGIFGPDFSLPWPLRWLAKFLRGKRTSLDAQKIIYFDPSLTLLGTSASTGYKAGGGDDRNIDITFSKEEINSIQKYIEDNGGKIGTSLEGVVLKSSFPFLSPRRWLSFRETIIIGEEGIGHIQKSWFKSRNSFLPYESIKVFTHFGITSKIICLLGDVTIQPVEGFGFSAMKQIKKVLSEKNILSSEGRIYKPALLSGKRSFNSPSYLVTNEGIFFKAKSLKGGTIEYLPYESISGYRKCSRKDINKSGWKEIFAPILIEGNRADARKGDGGSVTMVVPGIAFYRWNTLFFINGSLKKALKNKS
ncbi:MAG: hypothetical protein HOK17_04970 [Flammeovirgaceae bacterium]|jgi:hypothetical protein|nr:hypothetical protein [Flammeovirgaceae bacterium]